MYTAAGLRFVRTLARRGERVPAYLLSKDPELRGAAHPNQRPTGPRSTQSAHSRAIPR
jgi:hypothetical protein